MAEAPGSFGAAEGQAHGVEFEDPLSAKIHAWLRILIKTLRGFRVYSDNNETLKRYLSDCFGALSEGLASTEEFSLSVREDRLLHGRDAVLISDDRMEGLPFLLFRNAFRRVTLLRGMTEEELAQLIRAIITDYSVFDVVGEDLVTALWRLQLPHLRYVTIDTLTTEAGSGGTDAERAEVDRLQADVEAIVAAVYRSSLTGEDIVSGLSIGKEDLQALREIRDEPEEDLERLDQVTKRAVIDVAEEDLEAFAHQLEADNRDQLVRRTMEVLIRILFRERSGQDAFGAVDLLQQLLDSMLIGQRFAHATELIRLLRVTADDTSDMQKLHVARQLLLLFASRSRIIPLLAGLNDRVMARSVSELVAFLRTLGPPTVPALLRALPDIESPVHRRVIRDLVIDLGVPPVHVLHGMMEGQDWFIVRDLLTMAERHPPADVALLVDGALEHPHPRVREQGVKMLRSYRYGAPDERLALALDDSDPDVRRTAQRLAVSRSSPNAAKKIAHILIEDSADRDLSELKRLCYALASIRGPAAVDTLAGLLGQGLFSSLKNTDLPVAAAGALGTIDTEPSRAALGKGARSLIPKIRDACHRALQRIENQRAGGSDSEVTSDFDDGSGEFEAVSLEHGPVFNPVLPDPSIEQRPSVDPRPPKAATNFHQRTSGQLDIIPGKKLVHSDPELESTQTIRVDDLRKKPAPMPPPLTDDLVLTDELPLTVVPGQPVSEPASPEPPHAQRQQDSDAYEVTRSVVKRAVPKTSRDDPDSGGDE